MLISRRTTNIDTLASALDSDHASLSLASSFAEYPESNLRSDDINQAAMAWGHRQSQTTVSAFFSHSLLPESLDYVALFGLNRRTPTLPGALLPNLTPNMVRLIVDEHGPFVHNPRVIAFGTTSNLDIAGGFETLNQVLNPPELAMSGGYTPASLAAVNPALDSVINITFGNLAARPLDGIQTILIHCRDSEDVADLPTLTVVLRQSGADVATLALIEIERSYYAGSTPIGAIFTYTFDAALLPSAALPVQLRITGETTGTASVDFLAVTFRSEVTGTLFDTGWQTIEQSDRVAWTPQMEFPTPGGHYAFVQFSDFGVRSYENPDPPVPYAIFQHRKFTHFGLKIGRFTAGSAMEIPIKEGGVSMFMSWESDHFVRSSGGTLRAPRETFSRWEVVINFRPLPERFILGELLNFKRTVGLTVPAVYLIDKHNAEATDIVWSFWALRDSSGDGAEGIGALVPPPTPEDGDDEIDGIEDQYYEVEFIIREAAAMRAYPQRFE